MSNIEQFTNEDQKTVSEFLALLINLGMSSEQAYKTVDAVLTPLGWSFVFFNDHEDFWITSNEMK